MKQNNLTVLLIILFTRNCKKKTENELKYVKKKVTNWDDRNFK